MIRSIRPTPLRLSLLAALATLALFLVVFAAYTAYAQGQEVTSTRDATGENPPAEPTNLQVSAEHDSVRLTWTASTDQTVTHHAVLRRDRSEDDVGVFHVIEANAGPGLSHTDSSVSAGGSYVYRVKAFSPTGVSRWSSYARADTPAAPTATPETHAYGHTGTGAYGHTGTGAYGHTGTGAYGHTGTGAYGHTGTNACGHTGTNACGHTGTNACGHAGTHAYGHAGTDAYGHAGTHAYGHTGTHAYGHTGTHAYGHTGADAGTGLRRFGPGQPVRRACR